jgi:hypothetical protein
MRRLLLAAAALVVVLNLIVWAGDLLGGGGAVSGPDGSSYVTTAGGTAALAGTLERLGYRVVRLRAPLDQASLDPDGTLVVAEVGGAAFSSAELNRMESLITSGGRVLMVGPTEAVDRLLEDPPRWVSSGVDSAVAVGPLERAVAGAVPLSGFGSLTGVGADTPLLVGAGDRVVAVQRSLGRGTFVWLADPFPLRNRGLGVGGAAPAAVGLIDPAGPIYFDEYRHGYREQGSVWSLLPGPWRTVLSLVGVVTLLGLTAYGRRFGSPHDRHRRLPPGREMYLESVAAILERSGDRAAALSSIRAAAGRLRPPGRRDRGLTEAEVAALTGDDTSAETLLAADRGLATLIREREHGPG